MNSELLKRIFSSIILIPLVFFLIFKGSYYFYILLSFIFFIASYEWYNLSKDRFFNVFGYIFLLFSLYCTFQLRFSFKESFLPLFIVTIVCILTDIGGYTFGKTLKGPKLTKYSPNKTYSGLIGSFLLPFIFIPILIYLNFFTQNQLVSLFFFIIIVSTSSQIGDILISYFKRLSNLKDTGKLIPGHGGLLDRIDGMLFAFPVAYLLLKTNLINLY